MRKGWVGLLRNELGWVSFWRIWGGRLRVSGGFVTSGDFHLRWRGPLGRTIRGLRLVGYTPLHVALRLPMRCGIKKASDTYRKEMGLSLRAGNFAGLRGVKYSAVK